MGRGSRVASIALMALAGACEAPTLLRVRITSQFQVPVELAALHVTLRPEGVDVSGLPEPAPGSPPFTLDRAIPFTGDGAHGFEGELWIDVVPYEPLGVDHDVRIVVDPDVGAGCDNSAMPGVFGDYAPVRLLRRFTPGALELVHVDLTRDCCGVSCAAGLYCSRGQCIPEDGRCDDPPEVTITCGQGLCARPQPRCLLGRVNDCAGQQGQADLSMCGGATDADCDGRADTGPETIQYRDVDGDGFGDPATERSACGLLGGHVDDPSDCNDRAAGIRPGVPETCDNVDEDCDGAVDQGVTRPCNRGCEDGREHCTDGVFGGCDARAPSTELCNGTDDDCDGLFDEGVQRTVWRDADGDGYGNAAAPMAVCSVPGGYVANDRDCDDGNGAVNPGATETPATPYDDNCDGVSCTAEACNGLDDDCDGIVDDFPDSDAMCPVGGRCGGPDTASFNAQRGCCQLGFGDGCGFSMCAAGFVRDSRGCCCERLP